MVTSFSPSTPCRFNGHARLGRQAVESIDERAGYELWSDVLLVSLFFYNFVAEIESNLLFYITIFPEDDTSIISKNNKKGNFTLLK